MIDITVNVVFDLTINTVKGSIEFLRRNLHKIGKNTEFYCENYFVDDNDDCECGCNDGDDNNGLVQFHILVSSKLSIVSLKVFTVTV